MASDTGQPSEPNHAQYVVEQARAGADEETIVEGLQQQGVERDEARRVVGELYPRLMEAAEAQAYSSDVLPRAAIAAVVAAIVGGIVWGVIVVATDYEIGIVAWALGALAGYAVVYAASGRKGTPLQAIAVVASLLGILIGKYVTFAYELKKAAKDVAGQAAADAVSYFSSDTISDFFHHMDLVLSWYDLLWVGLAVWTAWKIPRGLGIAPRRTAIG